MLENLGRWFSLLFIIASIGVVLILSLSQKFLPLDPRDLLPWLEFDMIVFDMASISGRVNLQKVTMISIKKLTILIDILKHLIYFWVCFFLTISDRQVIR